MLELNLILLAFGVMLTASVLKRTLLELNNPFDQNIQNHNQISGIVSLNNPIDV